MSVKAFNRLYDICEERGYLLQVESRHDGLFLTIRHPSLGPLITWAAYAGSLDKTASMALPWFQEARLDA